MNLINVLTCVACVSAGLAGAVVGGCENSPVNTTPPEVAAKTFLDQTQTPHRGLPVCTGGDTNNDGYVTCTVMEDDGPPLSLQCAVLGAGTWFSPYTTGCKLTADRVQPGPQTNVTVVR